MRAVVEASDAQRIVMPESRSLTNLNSAADLRALVHARILILIALAAINWSNLLMIAWRVLY